MNAQHCIAIDSGVGGGIACGNNHFLGGRKMVSPEPFCLEIAAMLMAANLSREAEQCETVEETIWPVEQADALIAAAKEVAK